MAGTSQSNSSMDPSVHHPLMNTRPLITYSSMPMHMYPLTPNSQRSLRTKRRQVKNACTNCQRACKKCDDARPCLRCIKYGIGEECVDSQRKERKKGIKRGPYKKRDGKSELSLIILSRVILPLPSTGRATSTADTQPDPAPPP